MTVAELIHKWANSNFKKDKVYGSSDWEADNNEISNGWTIIGKHYPNFTIIRNYSPGGWGTSYSSSDIYRAIDNKNRILLVDSNIQFNNVFYNEGDIKNINQFITLIKDTFIESNDIAFNDICRFKEYHNNSRKRTIYGELNLKYGFKLDLPKVIKDRHWHIIKDIPIDFEYLYEKHRGWSFQGYDRYYFNSTIGQLLKNNITDHFTRKEIWDIKFKQWRLEYVPNKTYGSAKKHYLDSKLKNKAESEHAERIARRNKEKIDRERRERRSKFIGATKQMLSWYNGNNTYISHYIDYDCIKINGDNVKTNRGVNVPISKVKLLYKFFNDKINSNSIVDITKIKIPKKFRVLAGYPVIGIENRTINFFDYDGNKEELHYDLDVIGIHIGCHFIPWIEVENFIKREGLQW